MRHPARPGLAKLLGQLLYALLTTPLARFSSLRARRRLRRPPPAPRYLTIERVA
jgi:hypothetical protein